MNKRLIIIIQAGIIFFLTAALSVVCMVSVTGEKKEADTTCHYETETYEAVERETETYETETEQKCIEINNEREKKTSDVSVERGGDEIQTDMITQYSYQIEWETLGTVDAWYGSNQTETVEYFTPVLCLEIPDNEEKEERLNAMLAERYVKVLPDVEEKEWWERAQIKITYRSERYLGYEYISYGAMPENCSYEDLHFTLDLKREKWIEYPQVKGRVEYGYYPLYAWGTLYEELEEYQKKPVEEQNRLRGESGYDVKEVVCECEGIKFSCVQISGLENTEKEQQINQTLQQPLRMLIMNTGWEDMEKSRQKIFNDVQIYIAYKSEQWLSVVYSLKASEYKGGETDVGVTVNLESGKRYMLDDLFEIDGLAEWLCMNALYDEKNYRLIQGCILTEEERISSGKGKEGYLEVADNERNSFYLYKGKIVITTGSNFADREIPLPEVYEYLKVDPWYD